MTTSWRLRAKCAGDPLFLEKIDAVAQNRRRNAARRACDGCEVLKECARDCFTVDESGDLRITERHVTRGGVLLEGNTYRNTPVYLELLKNAEFERL